jgi:hypothetical protein
MAIDTTQFTRDLRATIADLSVNIRFPRRTGPIITASYAAGFDTVSVIEPGLEDVFSATLVAVKADFTSGLPEDGDKIEMQNKAGTWDVFEVKRVMGTHDPSNEDLTIGIGAT